MSKDEPIIMVAQDEASFVPPTLYPNIVTQPAKTDPYGGPKSGEMTGMEFRRLPGWSQEDQGEKITPQAVRDGKNQDSGQQR